MKRSEINQAVEKAKRLFAEHQIALPFFAYVPRTRWADEVPAESLIKRLMLGWDVTDFGSGDFSRVGSTLFTLRNGDINAPGVGSPYCEKLMVMDGCGQEIPMHYHVHKTEDIINRAGGTLAIQVYNALPDNSLDTEHDVVLWCDGVRRSFAPGTVIRVTTGNSVTLTPSVYHRFYAEGGDTIAGEVSAVNDDTTDNVFLAPSARFTGIEEDEPAAHFLVTEYV